jgi:hypothetical protein
MLLGVVATSATAKIHYVRANPVTFTVVALGSAVIGGHGAITGSATGLFNINTETSRICYDLSIEGFKGIKSASAYIHKGAIGVNGRVAVDLHFNINSLSPVVPCTEARKSTLSDILTHSANYYLDIQTVANPNNPKNALRGQLAIGKTLAAVALGSSVTAGHGDPSGSATSTFSLNTANSTICGYLSPVGIRGIKSASAYIQKGAIGVNGPIVIDLHLDIHVEHPWMGRPCLKAAKSILRDILRHPANYYLEIQTVTDPKNPRRAQLEYAKG